jgi:mono/diheme cytochrome c family protein
MSDTTPDMLDRHPRHRRQSAQRRSDRHRTRHRPEPASLPRLGVQVFAGNCANHDWDGKGVQSPYADLRGSHTINDPDATNLKAILLAGSNAPLPVEHAFMPPFARGHSDDELAAVANFVNGFFGNGTAKVATADIDKARKALP